MGQNMLAGAGKRARCGGVQAEKQEAAQKVSEQPQPSHEPEAKQAPAQESEAASAPKRPRKRGQGESYTDIPNSQVCHLSDVTCTFLPSLHVASVSAQHSAYGRIVAAGGYPSALHPAQHSERYVGQCRSGKS